MEEASLFVARALCGGSPASKKAGREIRPPPPAMESTRPARKVSGQIIKNGMKFMAGYRPYIRVCKNVIVSFSSSFVWVLSVSRSKSC